jgi:hypothetical protein
MYSLYATSDDIFYLRSYSVALPRESVVNKKKARHSWQAFSFSQLYALFIESY